MPILLAKKTLAAINAAIEADQGGAYRQNLQRVLPHMSDAYRGAEDNGFRSHLGASVMGQKCGRAIWYGFHWTTAPTFEGRMLRLFNRGHLEEGRLIAALLTIGCQVYQQDAEGKQYRISDHGGHFGGSGDGVVVGIPDLPAGTPALTEWKTHNDKSYQAVAKDGVREAKFEHFVQQQIYMHKMGLGWSLYGAVNKNDDHIHLELVKHDPAIAEQFVGRAKTVIMMRAAPSKIHESAGWYECKFCDHRPVCHLGAAPERNCRTCKHSEPDIHNGGWWCNNEERRMRMVVGPTENVSNPGETYQLTKERQLTACELYERF
jgi:hypothetical protein